MSSLVPFLRDKNLSDTGSRTQTRQELAEQDPRVNTASIECNLYSFPSFPALSDTDAPVEVEAVR
jgi:hypothetical protein